MHEDTQDEEQDLNDLLEDLTAEQLRDLLDRAEKEDADQGLGTNSTSETKTNTRANRAAKGPTLSKKQAAPPRKRRTRM